MIFYLYKITNKINGKIYVGVHKTTNVDDNYMGSGKLLKRAINKYGVESFLKEIIEFFPDEESMYLREQEIVTEEFLDRDDVYNLKIGGFGGFNHINSLESMKSVRSKNAYELDIEHKIHGGVMTWVMNRDRWEKFPELRNSAFRDIDIRTELCERARSENSIRKRKNTFKDIKHQQGSKNSQYGTCWIYHELIGNRKCNKNDLPEYIEQGWIKGRLNIK